MNGPQAQSVGRRQSYPAMIDFQGARIIPGGPDHWRLMEMACRAKFTQNADARMALLATGTRPLIHRVRRDSRTIPGSSWPINGCASGTACDETKTPALGKRQSRKSDALRRNAKSSSDRLRCSL